MSSGRSSLRQARRNDLAFIQLGSIRPWLCTNPRPCDFSLLQAVFVHGHADMPGACGGISQDYRPWFELRDVEHGARAPEHANMPVILQYQRSLIAICGPCPDQEKRARFDLCAADHQRTGLAACP